MGLLYSNSMQSNSQKGDLRVLQFRSAGMELNQSYFVNQGGIQHKTKMAFWLKTDPAGLH